MKTKTELAQYIVQALYALPDLPRQDHPEVCRKERQRKATLLWQYELAKKAMASIGREVPA